MQRLHTFRSSARPFGTKAPGVHACTSIARLARQQHKQRLSSPPASLAGAAGGAGDAARCGEGCTWVTSRIAALGSWSRRTAQH